jgi:predicted nucleic acid-binding protein
MKFVVDASVAIKWVVEEAGTTEAVALRRKANLVAPELLIAECANILWKKVQRKELSKEVARMAARLLKSAELELFPMRGLLEEATLLAIDLSHPAYDCLYLALAIASDCPFVTADERLARKLARSNFREKVMTLGEAAKA